MKVRHLVPAAGAALAVAAGTVAVLPPTASMAAPASSTRGDRVEVRVWETFLPAAKATRAFSYDAKRVPAGSRASVRSLSAAGRSRVTLRVHGLEPGSAYNAHVHVKPCAADPAASGAHYKNDPKGPENPQNEIWFSFRTDGEGDATATAWHPWTFANDRKPGSVVIHNPALPDGTQPRAGCLSVPFAP
ncbi:MULTISPECIES: hypothetical protein [Thermomonosporaceae]|uniref:hypothetical protein n=1 Tax=Thermomonosporaceae TaxID=2012 RepID=UPI00255B3917|nr:MULTISPECIES: hypothetical protein [Thermomonosporaceae]MDL4773490.1 hypothetical protein [Actinomadura xylanilytica]